MKHLGLAQLMAIWSDLKKSYTRRTYYINVKGGEILTVIYERMQTLSAELVYHPF
jgi:gamma-tubulin complex component 2